MVTALDGSIAKVAVLAFAADVLDAVITAFTAVTFAFKLDVFSRHIFLWLRLPCPGPGMWLEDCRAERLIDMLVLVTILVLETVAGS